MLLYKLLLCNYKERKTAKIERLGTDYAQHGIMEFVIELKEFLVIANRLRRNIFGNDYC